MIWGALEVPNPNVFLEIGTHAHISLMSHGRNCNIPGTTLSLHTFHASRSTARIRTCSKSLECATPFRDGIIHGLLVLRFGVPRRPTGTVGHLVLREQDPAHVTVTPQRHRWR